MSKRFVDAMIGLCVHDPKVLVEPPRELRNIAITALSRKLGTYVLSPKAKVQFLTPVGAESFEDMENRASSELLKHIKLLLLKDHLSPSNYDIQIFSEELRSDIKIVWAVAVKLSKKKWWKK